MKKYNKKWFLFWKIHLFLIGFLFKTTAQNLQVVTKTIQKEIAYASGTKINLNAQKADVFIKGKNQDKITITVKLIAKNSDKNTAEKELSYLNYEIKNSPNMIDLSNAYIMPKSLGKLKSQVKTIYEITLPNKSNVLIVNSFGETNINSFSGNLSIKFNYGRLTMTDIEGKIDIDSNYGDIEAESISGMLLCKSVKAESIFTNIIGNATIEAKYGSLKINLLSATTRLNVDAARCEIELSVKRFEDFKFDASNQFEKINVPPNFKGFVSNFRNLETLLYEPKSSNSLIKIQNSYSPILIFIDKNLQTHK
jgi:hypothetical protein